MDNESISELSRGKPGGHKPIGTILAERERMMLDVQFERNVDFYPGFGAGGTQATAEVDGIGRYAWSAKADNETQEQLEHRLRQQLEAWFAR